MKTMEIAALAMQGDMQKVAHISQNLANVQTAGYKRMVTVQRPFAAEWEAASVQTEAALDARQGSLRATGNPLDLAVDGEGFFAVQAPQGRMLVRQLSLRVGANGAVVNDAGLPVLGERGELRLDRGETALRVGANGEVFTGSRSIGRLQLWQVAPGALQAAGEGLFQAGEGELQSLDTTKLAVGFQETSNVNSSAEMVRLLETTRHFEAMARTVQGYDEAMEKAIRKLGDL